MCLASTVTEAVLQIILGGLGLLLLGVGIGLGAVIAMQRGLKKCDGVTKSKKSEQSHFVSIIKNLLVGVFTISILTLLFILVLDKFALWWDGRSSHHIKSEYLLEPAGLIAGSVIVMGSIAFHLRQFKEERTRNRQAHEEVVVATLHQQLDTLVPTGYAKGHRSSKAYKDLFKDARTQSLIGPDIHIEAVRLIKKLEQANNRQELNE